MVDAYAKVENGEIWLHNMHISPHLEGNRSNVPPIRSRKLLLKRAQIDRLQGLTQQKGLALVPLTIVFERGFAKLELAIARGKKLYDKRESIKERDQEREARREVFGRG
jgi:SsrA-binding protein